MRLNYNQSAVILKVIGWDQYSQPILSSKPSEVKVVWFQDGDEVTIKSSFPIPLGTHMFLGTEADFKAAERKKSVSGMNIWEVSRASYGRDVKNRIEYYGATLIPYQNTNLSTIP